MAHQRSNPAGQTGSWTRLVRQGRTRSWPRRATCRHNCPKIIRGDGCASFACVDCGVYGNSCDCCDCSSCVEYGDCGDRFCTGGNGCDCCDWCDCCKRRDSCDYGMNTMPVSHRDGPLAHGRAQYEYAARLKSSASVTEGEFRPACTASGD